MSSIFADNAPKFWERLIPVIPLKPMDKAPAIARWQTYADVMPTQEEQQIWLRAFPNGNIGLPLGPVAGMVAIDIDNPDPRVMDILAKIVPISPWVRVGQKGCVMVYRWDGQRTFNIKEGGTDGSMIVQCLSKGAQIAIPPSIHPKTQMPYVAGADLLDVMALLPSLPKDLERTMRDAFRDGGFNVGTSGSTKVSVFVPAGARDNSMVSMAGILSRSVWRGERTLLEALGEMKTWLESFVEKVAGDDISVEKAQGKLVEFLVRDVTGEKKIELPVGWDEGLTHEDKEKLGLGFTSDNEAWDFGRIKQFLVESFTEHPEPGSPPWMTAVEVALGKLARNKDISSLDEDRLITFIAEQSNKQITKGAAKKRVHEFRKAEREGNDHSEIAQYVLKDMAPFGEIRFDADRFWQWKGACWERIDDVVFKKHIAEEYGAYPAAKRASDHNGIVRVMATLVTKKLSTTRVRGLNFANGFLNEDLTLSVHNPDFGCQYVLPYRYLPDRAGHCPMFMQYLHDCWGQDPDFVDKVDALQEVMAATMFGLGTEYQRCVCLFGEGRTGKTRLVEIMKGLLPPNCSSSVPPQDWDDKFLPTELFGRLLNVAGELSETRLIAGDQFKKIVGGESISGQYKNGQIFQFEPFATHWFASNHLPKTRDTSDGFTRRWLFFKFNYPVPEEKKIIELDRVILAAEREEIAAWAAQGVHRLKKNNGFTLPMSHMVLVDQVANDANSVRYFLAQSAEVSFEPDQVISEAKLYHAYYAFCISTQIAKPVMQRSFHRLMQGLENAFKYKQVVGKTSDNRDIVEYEGLCLRKSKV